MAPDQQDKEMERVLTRYRYLTHYIATHNDEHTGAYENEIDTLEEQYPIEELLDREQRMHEKNDEVKEQLRRIKTEEKIIRKIRSTVKGKGIVL